MELDTILRKKSDSERHMVFLVGRICVFNLKYNYNCIYTHIISGRQQEKKFLKEEEKETKQRAMSWGFHIVSTARRQRVDKVQPGYKILKALLKRFTLSSEAPPFIVFTSFPNNITSSGLRFQIQEPMGDVTHSNQNKRRKKVITKER